MAHINNLVTATSAPVRTDVVLLCRSCGPALPVMAVATDDSGAAEALLLQYTAPDTATTAATTTSGTVTSESAAANTPPAAVKDAATTSVDTPPEPPQPQLYEPVTVWAGADDLTEGHWWSVTAVTTAKLSHSVHLPLYWHAATASTSTTSTDNNDAFTTSSSAVRAVHPGLQPSTLLAVHAPAVTRGSSDADANDEGYCYADLAVVLTADVPAAVQSVTAASDDSSSGSDSGVAPDAAIKADVNSGDTEACANTFSGTAAAQIATAAVTVEPESVLVLLQELTPDAADAGVGRGVYLRLRHPLHTTNTNTNSSNSSGLPWSVTRCRVKFQLQQQSADSTTAGAAALPAVRVFRVVVSSAHGCAVSIHSTGVLAAGDAAIVWRGLDSSSSSTASSTAVAATDAVKRTATSESGSYEAAPPGDWRVIFRRALAFLPTTSSSIIATASSEQSSSDVESATVPSAQVRVMLHVAAAAAGRVQLCLVNTATGTETPLPLLGARSFTLTAGPECSLVGYVRSGASPLPAGSWQLSTLCEGPGTLRTAPPVVPETGGTGAAAAAAAAAALAAAAAAMPVLPKQACQWRALYGADYTANKQLRLFRDVARCTVPGAIALRLCCSTPATTATTAGSDAGAGVGAGVAVPWVALTVTEEATGRVVAQRSSPGEVCLLSVTPPLTASAIAAAAAAAAAAAPGTVAAAASDKAKAAKGGKAGAAVAVEPPLALIVEATIDDTRMAVPAAWRSVQPHYFTPTTATATSSTAGSTALLSWRLDVAAGAEVQLAHDCTQLQAHAAVAAAWESAGEGRADRAKLLYEQVQRTAATSAATSAESSPLHADITSSTLLFSADTRFQLPEPAEGEDPGEWLVQRSVTVGIDAATESTRQGLRAALPPTVAASLRVIDQSVVVAVDKESAEEQDTAQGAVATVLSAEDVAARRTAAAAKLEVAAAEQEAWTVQRAAAVTAAAAAVQAQAAAAAAWREQVQAERLAPLQQRDAEVRAMMDKLAARKAAAAAELEAAAAATKKTKK
jgi:trimeric autotransporter adhesin